MWISQNPYKSVHFAEPSPEKDCNPLEFASSKFHKVQCITICVSEFSDIPGNPQYGSSQGRTLWGNLLCRSYHTGFNRIKQFGRV